MKLLVPFLFLCTGLAVFGQKPVLVDSFGKLPCDDLSARSDGLAQQVARSAGGRGLVIAHPKKNGRPTTVQQFKLILASFEFAKLDDGVSFVIGDDQPDFGYELWLIPLGAKEPEYIGQKWAPPEPVPDKAFIFNVEDEMGECPTFVPRKFAELLANAPGSHANLVLRPGDRNSYPASGFAQSLVSDLNKAGVPRNRIHIFYARGTSALTYAEFWFVPAKH